jgi:hypothetical protein
MLTCKPVFWTNSFDIDQQKITLTRGGKERPSAGHIVNAAFFPSCPLFAILLRTENESGYHENGVFIKPMTKKGVGRRLEGTPIVAPDSTPCLFSKAALN